MSLRKTQKSASINLMMNPIELTKNNVATKNTQNLSYINPSSSISNQENQIKKPNLQTTLDFNSCSNSPLQALPKHAPKERNENGSTIYQQHQRLTRRRAPPTGNPNTANSKRIATEKIQNIKKTSRVTQLSPGTCSVANLTYSKQGRHQSMNSKETENATEIANYKSLPIKNAKSTSKSNLQLTDSSTPKEK